MRSVCPVPDPRSPFFSPHGGGGGSLSKWTCPRAVRLCARVCGRPCARGAPRGCCLFSADNSDVAPLRSSGFHVAKWLQRLPTNNSPTLGGVETTEAAGFPCRVPLGLKDTPPAGTARVGVGVGAREGTRLQTSIYLSVCRAGHDGLRVLLGEEIHYCPDLSLGLFTLESVLGRSSRPPLWQKCLKSAFLWPCHGGHPPLASLHISPNRRGSIRRAPPWQHGSQLTKCCLDGMRLLLSAVEPFAQILLSIDEFFVLQQFSPGTSVGWTQLC